MAQTMQHVVQTVLIVDDHPTFRRLARRLIEDAGFTVVGEVGDGASALVQATALEPDVVLLDILLPDSSGFDVAAALANSESPPLVVLTSSRSRGDFGTAIDVAHASGFLAKSDLTATTFRGLVRPS